MARRSPALGLVAAALALLVAAAPGAHAAEAMFPGGCVPCSSCTTSWCWQTCRPSCGGWNPITPDNIVVSGDSCRASGASYGPTAGASACASARSRCSGALSVGSGLGAAAPIGGVTLSQCSSIAFGSCQQGANLDSCGGAAEFGYGSCDAATFRAIFAQEASSVCRNYAITVTDVSPGSNQWVVAPYVPPYNPVQPVYPYGPVIIGSAAPGAGSAGGGLGSAVGAAAAGAAPSAGGGDGASGGSRRLMGVARRMLRML